MFICSLGKKIPETECRMPPDQDVWGPFQKDGLPIIIFSYLESLGLKAKANT